MASTHHSPLGSPKRPCGGLELEADICRQTHQFRTDLSADAVATLYACFMTTWVRVRDGWRTVELHFDQPRATTRSISYFLTRPFPRWYSTFFRNRLPGQCGAARAGETIGVAARSSGVR